MGQRKMRDNFERASLFVLKQEVEPGHESDGSLHTDPADPGGTTRFGISQRAYPDVDLKKLDWPGAKKIYLSIWMAAGCDELHFPLDIIVFDTAFNMGVEEAKKIYELMGSQSADPNNYLLFRILTYFYKKPKYFRGWVKRTLNLWQEVA